MPSKKKTVCILIPTLNEVDGLRWFMPRLDKSWYDQVIIADGHSTDGTLEYCRENGYDVIFQTGRGLPNAMSTAIKHCRTDLVITVSPDGNVLPELIPNLVAKLEEGYDMVIVSRYLGQAKSYDDNAATSFGNWLFTKVINLLFGGRYTDTLGIFRGYKREAIETMGLPSMEEENWLRRRYCLLNSWEVGSSIRAAKQRLNVAEIPGDEPKRIGGLQKSFFITNGLGVLFQIILDRLRP